MAKSVSPLVEPVAFRRHMPLTQVSLPHFAEKKSKDNDSDDGFDDRDELMDSVDAVCSSNRAARMGALSMLATYFRLHSNSDVNKYESTLTNALFNCMRRGKCEERCRAATVTALMAWSLRNADETFDKACRYAERVLTSEIKKGDDYSEFVVAISVICFVESPDSHDVLELCKLLLKSAEHEKSNLHKAACVSAWTFLFATVPPTHLGGPEPVEMALQTMHSYLFDDDTGVRVAAGEAITMIFFRCNLRALTGSNTEKELESGSVGGLEAILERMKAVEKNLGESENRKSKGDRTSLRKTFKEYLRILDGQLPKPQKITLPNGQTVTVELYEDLVFVSYLRPFLGDGFLRSMLTNPIIQQVLDFSPVEYQVERYTQNEKVSREKGRARERRQKNENQHM
jgi:hypothetical protein